MSDRHCGSKYFLIQDAGMGYGYSQFVFIRKWRCLFQFSKLKFPVCHGHNMLAKILKTAVFVSLIFFISYQENKAIQRELSTSSESLDDGTIERHVRCICLYFSYYFRYMFCSLCLKSKKKQTNNIFNWYIRADWLSIVLLIFCVRRGWAHSEVTMKTCSPTRKMPGKRHGGSTRCTNLPQERNDCLFLHERLFISISHGSATCRYPSSSHTRLSCAHRILSRCTT